DVGRKDLAVAVDDIRPRGCDGVLYCVAARTMAVADRCKHDQSSADHRVDRGECHHGQSDAHARFGGAIDVGSIKHAAHQPLPPWFHCRPPGTGAEPVTEPACAAASIVWIIAPIGSGSPGLTK